MLCDIARINSLPPKYFILTKRNSLRWETVRIINITIKQFLENGEMPKYWKTAGDGFLFKGKRERNLGNKTISLTLSLSSVLMMLSLRSWLDIPK